jgi:flagella basal body P-ring formation protein FlgA
MMKPASLLLLWLASEAVSAASGAASIPPSPVAPAAEMAACVAVNGDQILGGDLSDAVPAFRVIPPDTRIAPAPTPGGTRNFSQAELASLGARFGIPAVLLSRGICFRVPAASLNRDAVIAAMRRTFPSLDTRIELADVSSEPAPPGVIHFPLEGLVRPALAESPALWRGEVVAGSRHFNVWAHARISTPLTRLIATEDLKPGQALQSHQIRTEIVDGFPVVGKVVQPTAIAITGMTPLRSIATGSEIRPENLVHPFDVLRGDLVQVEVRLGKARLSMRGRAEAAGRVGEMIAVRNPESNKLFQARVEGKGFVLVDPRHEGAE